ncbi:MAG: hypothetical protein ACM336_05805 [Acidobacteriota bacterium]
MRKLACLAFAALALGIAAYGSQQSAGRTLKVKLNYTGSGTVDEKHKIVVFLFDTPEFAQGMPVAAQTAASKDATVAFEGFDAGTVYLVTAYDPKGEYGEAQTGPPPSGSSLGMYSKTPGTPEPIKVEPGKPVEVEVAFDDTVRMP